MLPSFENCRTLNRSAINANTINEATIAVYWIIDILSATISLVANATFKIGIQAVCQFSRTPGKIAIIAGKITTNIIGVT